ncbi:phage tail sheath subtilisin-like domain-containing protein [Roseomonas chloroacetimidivorans]|uniref:phage tail sheath subtilisin-like domain-containing protein n=1 Tax=Roseomonas chloroacetimidivorans TaxID=1766656 RepID=UPI003C783A65
MSISFSKYDRTNRVPGVWAEFDPSNANTAAQNLRGLIIGQGETGKVIAGLSGLPVISSGLADAQQRYGARSPLAFMTGDYRKNDPTGELWYLPLADSNGAGTAEGSIAFAGTATSAATMALYIGGERIEVPVAVGDTAAIIATNAAADISQAIVPVTADAEAGTVTLTATGAGVWGNEIPIMLNFGGIPAGEAMPAGITATVTAMTGGTGTPALTPALAGLGDTTYDFIVCPYTDTASLDALKAFLDDTAGRWSWQNQLFGGFFTAFRGTLGERVAFGTSRNDEHGSCIGFYGSPTPAWRWAAAYAGVCANSLRVDPALPLQNVAINGVYAPATADRDAPTYRNSLLYDGISTYKVGNDGTVFLERSVTFYQKNAAGVSDNSYLDTETPYTLAYLARDMKAYLATTFARKKLVADGTNIPGGSNMVTSQTVLAAAISRYKTYCTAGYAQNFDAFRAGARGENQGNGLVALLLPFDVANQLRSIVCKISFVKS